jgi:hypothetical protein
MRHVCLALMLVGDDGLGHVEFSVEVLLPNSHLSYGEKIHCYSKTANSLATALPMPS